VACNNEKESESEVRYKEIVLVFANSSGMKIYCLNIAAVAYIFEIHSIVASWDGDVPSSELNL
jgi:hypothetical protein